MPATDNFYETPKAISEYLLFHYGSDEQFLLDGLGPKDALRFADRCAALAARHEAPRRRALDLGCAVGGSSFALSSRFNEVIGIDFSHGLIEAAQRLARGETLTAHIAEEGDLTSTIELRCPVQARPERVQFRQGDALRLPNDLGQFDFILMANLIDRLPDPRACLRTIGRFLAPGGILAITSPYTWLESFTPKSNWLGGYIDPAGNPVRSDATLQTLLAPEFDAIEALNLPFLIREHARKNQYSIAHATLWRRRAPSTPSHEYNA